MTDYVFHLNGSLVSYFSLFLMSAAIVYSMRQRKLAGYPLPAWGIYIFIFLALDALTGVLLTGFQLSATPYFYSGRRLFSFFAVLFIFLAIFDFSEKDPQQGFQTERRIVFAFIGAQMFSNAGWLVLNFFDPARIENLIWLETANNLLFLLNFLWLANLSRRKGASLRVAGKLEPANALTRFSWAFAFGALLPAIIALRGWLHFAAQAHLVAGSFGWMIFCELVVLIFLRLERERTLWRLHIALLVLLVLLLALGLVAEFSYNRLGGMLSPAEIDRLLLPFVVVQAGIALFAFLALPRWLEFISPDKTTQTPALKKPLTSRQEEVMRLLAEGLSNQQIAEALHITQQTVKYHISKLMTEQGKSNRRELGELARETSRDNPPQQG